MNDLYAPSTSNLGAHHANQRNYGLAFLWAALVPLLSSLAYDSIGGDYMDFFVSMALILASVTGAYHCLKKNNIGYYLSIILSVAFCTWVFYRGSQVAASYSDDKTVNYIILGEFVSCIFMLWLCLATVFSTGHRRHN